MLTGFFTLALGVLNSDITHAESLTQASVEATVNTFVVG